MAGVAGCALFGSVAQAETLLPGVSFGLEAAAQPTFERQAFWGLAQAFAPTANYKTTTSWLELYAKPFANGQWQLRPELTLDAGLSVIGSATLGEDVFQQGDTGRILLEDGFLTLHGTSDDGPAWMLSGGAQRYTLGQGLILAMGAGNGFERGAAATAPRRAWQLTGIARTEMTGWTGELFYLKPNELKSSDTGTQLAGGRVAWSAGRGASVGAAWFKALASAAPYPKAPVTIIPDGRNGLETLDVYWTLQPAQDREPGFFFEGEAALQHNPRIDMRANGWGVNLGYIWADQPYAPRFTISARRFTGDNPATPALERFDALFYDGAPNTWSSGGNGSFAFYNSNLRVLRLRLDLNLTPADFVNLNYWFVQADQLNSPVQYGQAGRLHPEGDNMIIVSGFPKRDLSQELYAEYTRVLSPNLFVTGGLAAAFPQSGVQAIVPQGARPWYGALVNLNLRY
jgi:hypothetical protein